MPKYVTSVRTEDGDLQIDYKSLANLPTSDGTLLKSGEFADAKVVGEKIQKINNEIKAINDEIKGSGDNTQGIGSILNTHMSTIVTKTENGHMIAADKAKLDEIEEHANNYSLPTASNSVLGGVTTTSNVESADGLTACPIVNGVPYYYGNTLADFDIKSTPQELNLLSGLSTVSEKPEADVVTLVTGEWVGNEQVVAMKYVTVDNLVMVAPEPSSENYTAYSESNIRCIAQSDGFLTFRCEDAPKSDILVNVVVLYN